MRSKKEQNSVRVHDGYLFVPDVLNRNEDDSPDDKGEQQGGENSGKNECFLANAAQVFAFDDQDRFIHKNSLSSCRLKLPCSGGAFYQLDENFIQGR